MTKVSLLFYLTKRHFFPEVALQMALDASRGMDVEFLVLDDTGDDAVADAVKLLPHVTAFDPVSCSCAMTAMRNMLRKASGEYVMMLNGDTLLLAGCMKMFILTLDENPGAGGVYGLQCGYDVRSGDIAFVRGGPLSYFRLFSARPFAAGSMMLRRQCIRDAGGVLPLFAGMSMGWDYYLYYRMLVTRPFIFLPRLGGCSLWRGERSNAFYKGEDCEVGLIESANDIITGKCRELFMESHKKEIDELVSGREITAGSRFETTAILGLVIGMTVPFSREYRLILDAAIKLAPDDFGIHFAEVDYLFHNKQWQPAIDKLHEIMALGNDCGIALQALKMKKKIMTRLGAPAETISSVNNVMNVCRNNYYFTADDREKITAAIKVLLPVAGETVIP